MNLKLRTDTESTACSHRTWVSLLARVVVHVTGVSVVGAILLFAVVSPETVALVAGAVSSTPELADGMYARLATHLASAAAIWTCVWLVIRKIAARTGGASAGESRSHQKPVKWKLRAGTVMTEMLIILPVLLLMVFGLSQFALNNVTAVLARYAAFEGARTVWAWESEASAGRRGVDQAQVADRARIAVALAMTPAAPGDFIMDEGSASDELRRVRLAMYNHFRGPTSPGVTWAMGDFDLNEQAVEGNKSFTRALDRSSFATRAARKLTHAYLATDIGNGGVAQADDALGLLIDRQEVGMRFVFWHQQTMPLVGDIFGEERTLSGVGGRRGYYNPIEIEHTFPRQPHSVNAGWPRR